MQSSSTAAPCHPPPTHTHSSVTHVWCCNCNPGTSAPTSTDQTTGATVHHGVTCDCCGTSPILGVRHKSYQTPNYDACTACIAAGKAAPHAPFRTLGQPGLGGGGAGGHRQATMLPYLAGAAGPPPLAPQAAAASSSGNRSAPRAAPTAGAPAGAAAAQRHRALAEWVWAYYSQGRASAAAGPAPTAVAAAAAAGGGGSSSSCVGITQRGPLYLQHEGHSRTVVGIERVAPPGQTAEYSLLLLDPGLGNDELLGSLRCVNAQ